MTPAVNHSINIRIALGVFLVAATLIVYGQVVGHDFVRFDDKAYVTENHYVKNGWSVEGLKWALTTRHHSHWHPLTWLSHMTDCQLFGMDPAWHHLTNLFLHLLNTLLLFFLLDRMTGEAIKSAFVAALFSLHPLHVETVAWVADRKDLLSAFLWFITMWGYLWYSAHPSVRRYLLVFALFMLALTAKPMAITLPLVLLLIDYWPLKLFSAKIPAEAPDSENSCPRQGRRLLLEKAGFFVVVFISGAITVISIHQGRGLNPYRLIADMELLGNALVHYAVYIQKTIWPAGLATPYPTHEAYGLWQFIGAGVLLTGISFFAFWKACRCPYLLTGWLWFVITLLPVIGISPIGPQKITDRYTYIPLVGLFIMIAWGIPDAMGKWRYRRPAALFASAAAIIALMVGAWLQTGYWKDSESLYRRAISATKDNYKIHTNLGVLFVEKGEYEKAIHHFREAIKIRPDFVDAYSNMGIAFKEKGRIDKAKAYYYKALEIKPRFSKAHYNLGVAFEEEGRFEKALYHYRKAVKFNPKYAIAYNNIGVILANGGDFEEAMRYFSKALKYEPDNKKARKNFINARRLIEREADSKALPE